MTLPEYDSIVEGYEKATVRPLRKFCYDYTVETLIGDLSGKRVLDLACGEGISTRMMKALGAKEVVGIDISTEQIKKAKQKGGENISYYVLDVFDEDFSRFGKFDVVTGIMLVHYASSRDKLTRLFAQVRQSLKEGGILYTLVVNPAIIRSGYKKYGVKIFKVNKEGMPVKIELHDFNWNKFCDITDYYWKEETYTSMLKDAGFRVHWDSNIVSPKGIEFYGHDFWKDLLSVPLYKMITARA